MPEIWKALSIRQPYAFLIVNGYKDIENRDWNTSLRGRILIHAPKQVDDSFDWRIFAELGLDRPSTFDTGGIVGAANLTKVVTSSHSRWFRGTFGFMLAEACPLAFVPYRGKLGFFDVPNSIFMEE